MGYTIGLCEGLPMQTASQLYIQDCVLTRVLAGDPSLTVIENHREHCGVLLAGRCWQPSWSPTLHLEEAFWVRFAPQACAVQAVRRVALMPWDGAFAALDSERGLFLPNLSARPYCTVFFPEQDFATQVAHLRDGLHAAFFRFIQSHYAELPGFEGCANRLTTPADYAMLSPPADLAAAA